VNDRAAVMMAGKPIGSKAKIAESAEKSSLNLASMKPRPSLRTTEDFSPWKGDPNSPSNRSPSNDSQDDIRGNPSGDLIQPRGETREGGFKAKQWAEEGRKAAIRHHFFPQLMFL